jgi:hypothetical protein
MILNIPCEVHLYGSSHGYQEISSSYGVQHNEKQVLDMFGFGEIASDEFAKSILQEPTVCGRPLPTGRIAITRLFPGENDVAGRSTLELRSLIINRKDWNYLRDGRIKSFCKDQSIWKRNRFTNKKSQILQCSFQKDTTNDNESNEYLSIYSKVANNPVSTSAFKSSNDRDNGLLMLLQKLPDQDILNISWGIRMLSTGLNLTICSMHPKIDRINNVDIIDFKVKKNQLLIPSETTLSFISSDGSNNEDIVKKSNTASSYSTESNKSNLAAIWLIIAIVVSTVILWPKKPEPKVNSVITLRTSQSDLQKKLLNTSILSKRQGDQEGESEQQDGEQSDDESTQQQQQYGEQSDDESTQQQQQDGEQSDDESTQQQQQDGEQSGDEPTQQQQQDGEQSDDESTQQQQQDGEQSDDEPTQQQQQDGEQSDDEPTQQQQQDGEQSDDESSEQDISDRELESTDAEKEDGQGSDGEVGEGEEKINAFDLEKFEKLKSNINSFNDLDLDVKEKTIHESKSTLNLLFEEIEKSEGIDLKGKSKQRKWYLPRKVLSRISECNDKIDDLLENIGYLRKPNDEKGSTRFRRIAHRDELDSIDNLYSLYIDANGIEHNEHFKNIDFIISFLAQPSLQEKSNPDTDDYWNKKLYSESIKKIFTKTENIYKLYKLPEGKLPPEVKHISEKEVLNFIEVLAYNYLSRKMDELITQLDIIIETDSKLVPVPEKAQEIKKHNSLKERVENLKKDGRELFAEINEHLYDIKQHEGFIRHLIENSKTWSTNNE